MSAIRIEQILSFDSKVIDTPITGYVSRAGTLTTTDTILQALEKLNGNIGSLVTGVSSFNTRTGAVVILNTDITTALTFTPVTNARTITINGTTLDLTADRSWTITVTIGSTMANTNYYVDISPQDLLTAVNWYISSKTTTQFTITFVTALTGSINFDWIVTP